MTLRDVMERLTEDRVELGRIFTSGLATAVGHFEKANGQVPLEGLTSDHVRAMVRMLIAAGRGPKTANNYRGAILYLWERSRDQGSPPCPRSELRKLKEPRRVPQAWHPEEFAALVRQCRHARTRRGWGPLHWEALVMCVYDTSLRIGCLLKSRLNQLDTKRRMLYVPGEFQKSGRDTWQPLHPDTVRMLERLPRREGDGRLFPWPFHKDELWRQFKKHVLIPADLPHGRRDCFHRIRRTSYTLVAKRFGIAAASEHASHTEDLSRYYLDRTMLDRPNPLDALPRPRAG